jgi:hypothetical protein
VNRFKLLFDFICPNTDSGSIASFFDALKSELFYVKKYQSIDDLKSDIKAYIDYYNNDRIKFKQNEPGRIPSSILSNLKLFSKLLGSV